MYLLDKVRRHQSVKQRADPGSFRGSLAYQRTHIPYTTLAVVLIHAELLRLTFPKFVRTLLLVCEPKIFEERALKGGESKHHLKACRKFNEKLVYVPPRIKFPAPNLKMRLFNS